MLDLSVGGLSWDGWRLSKYGRAKDLRLIAPSGEIFSAEEILADRRLLFDLDYLQVRVKQLEAEMRKTPVRLSEMDLLTLQAAASILSRLHEVRLHSPV